MLLNTVIKKIPLLTISLILISSGLYAQSTESTRRGEVTRSAVERKANTLNGNHILKITIKNKEITQKEISIVTSNGVISSKILDDSTELGANIRRISANITLNDDKTYNVQYEIYDQVPVKTGKDSISYCDIGISTSATLSPSHPVTVYQTTTQTYIFEIIKTPPHGA